MDGLCKKMSGRNDCSIADSLEAMDNVMAQATQTLQDSHNGGAQNRGDNKFFGLGKFQKNKPSMFKGKLYSEGAQTWIQDIEKFCKVMTYTNEKKLSFGTHMLA